jgi:hypothetical protein
MTKARMFGAVALLLALGACMLLPGRFTSDLALHKDGTFAFRYAGEIILMPLAPSPTSNKEEEEKQVFEESPCTSEETGDQHDCSAQELAKQRSAWEAEQAESKQRKVEEDTRNRKAMSAMMGGLDPTDPKSAQEFADRLSRQQGWKSVVSKGNGKFEVVFEAAGRLDHDFSFPVIERLPMVVPFVTVIRRNDGTVRVDAPAFTPSASSPQIPGLIDAASSKDKGNAAGTGLDGTFTVRTDGQILANNTDEGPRADPATGGSRLDWKVNARTAAAPTALIRLTKP